MDQDLGTAPGTADIVMTVAEREQRGRVLQRFEPIAEARQLR
jgi:hypothetical protein